jgi:hypothetical protein
MDENLKKQLESLAKRVEEAESNVNAAKNIINKIHEDYLRVDYTQIEGETGKFNGTEMVTDEGKKFKVNENYAAKSKLVYGDVLKLIEEDGKNIYKQIEKIEKERVEGILTKKEGEWYLLTDRGSHKVSDAAAEYHKAEINSQAVAYLPADDLEAPFATLDTVESPHVVEKESKKKVTRTTKDKKDNKKEENIKDMNKKEMDLKKKTKKSPAEKKTAPKSKAKPKTPSKKTTSKPKTGTDKKESTKRETPKKSTTSASKKVLADDDLV